MNRIIRLVCGGAFLAATSSVCFAPAQAAAMVGVKAFWSVNFFDYELNGPLSLPLPNGVSFSCFGGVTASLALGCFDQRSLILTNNSPADITSSLFNTGGFSITNTTNEDIPGFFKFFTTFSAFNSGGPAIGASVDDPLTEYAAFSSSVSGPGVSDFHSCNTINGPFIGGPNACGVQSPDFSNGEVDFGSLAVGQTYTATYHLNISAEAIGAPEPATLALFGAGLAGVTAMRRRKNKAA